MGERVRERERERGKVKIVSTLGNEVASCSASEMERERARARVGARRSSVGSIGFCQLGLLTGWLGLSKLIYSKIVLQCDCVRVSSPPCRGGVALVRVRATPVPQSLSPSQLGAKNQITDPTNPAASAWWAACQMDRRPQRYRRRYHRPHPFGQCHR